MAQPDEPPAATAGLAAFGFGGPPPLNKDEQKSLSVLEGHMSKTALKKETINPNSPQSLAVLIRNLKAANQTVTHAMLLDHIARLVERLRLPGGKKNQVQDGEAQTEMEGSSQPEQEGNSAVSSPEPALRTALTAPSRREVEGIVSEAVAPLLQQIQKVASSIDAMSTSYRDALVRPAASHPPPAQLPSSTLDPRAMARVQLQSRQFVAAYPLDGDLRGMSNQAILAAANKAINVTIDDLIKQGVVDHPDHLRRTCIFVAVTHTRPGMLLFELGSPEARTWLFADDDLATLRLWAHNFGYDIDPKCPSHTTIAFNVPLTHEPDTDLCEIEATNQLEIGSITRTLWVKHPSRRRQDQANAHLIIEFKTPENANRAVVSGLIVRGKKVTVEQRKREPPRCRKCSKYGHYHASCREIVDVLCGTCGGAHETATCTSRKRHCVNCREEGHASWDRSCPVFQQKCLEHDYRYPENVMPFFMTDEPWTHATVPPSVKPGPA